jgi:GAF domain-containing protein
MGYSLLNSPRTAYQLAPPRIFQLTEIQFLLKLVHLILRILEQDRLERAIHQLVTKSRAVRADLS